MENITHEAGNVDFILVVFYPKKIQVGEKLGMLHLIARQKNRNIKRTLRTLSVCLFFLILMYVFCNIEIVEI